MLNILTEMLLSEYFLYTAVCGKLISDRKKLLKRLMKVFLLPESRFKKLYSLTENEEVRDVRTREDYMRYRRIQKYSEMTGTDSGFSPEINDVLSIKGKSLEKLDELGFRDTEDMSECLIYRQICEGANKGIVSAIRILGLLQYEGIFIRANEREGRKNLEKAAQWNSEEGILTALYYDVRNRQENINRLYTIASGTVFEGIVNTAEKKYKINADGFTDGNKLMKKAIGSGILKAEIYSPQYARFIYSSVLKYKDKERALFSGNKEILATTSELPLKLAYSPIDCDTSAFKSLSDSREKELEKITRCAANSDLRTAFTYRPLCVCTDSEYLSATYTGYFKEAFKGAHIEYIKVADLIESDLEPGNNNVFIRSCEEDKNNVYFLYFKGEINHNVMEAVKGFLNSEKRKKFRLLHPAVVLDLSPVLPVCFCDRANAKLLKQCCDVITAAPVSGAEKSAVIADIFRAKEKMYGVSEIRIEPSAAKRLCEFSVDRAESIIDRIVRFHRRKGQPLTITGDLIKEDEEQTAKNTYGFGGAVNESK